MNMETKYVEVVKTSHREMYGSDMQLESLVVSMIDGFNRLVTHLCICMFLD